MNIFFGFGANREVAMIQAITGKSPQIVGEATLRGYQLCIQSLKDIPTHGHNPRRLLRKAWGSDFRSYVIRKEKSSSVGGTVFRISRYDRKLLDMWELVPKDWQYSTVVRVTLANGKTIRARTQTLPIEQQCKKVTSVSYASWLMPEEDFVDIASRSAVRYKLVVF
ncbi:gamma-glutamylcyclotransferase [Candidatus Saccharibacteria bacterium]|nr:gamma-glutamylcyclotransferase [Candidatus Saccharibacteria bacterium]